MTVASVFQDFVAYVNWVLGPGQPQLVFWVLSAVVLVSAIGVVTTRNLMHAAMLLALCFIATAGVFVLLNAEFLAAVQVLVYAGGVVTLIVFAIMLSASITGKKAVTHNRQSITALGVSVMMAFVMVAILFLNQSGQYVGPGRWWVTPGRNDFPAESNVQLVGKSLMSTYTLAFWIASIILIIAMVGALIIASTEKKVPDEPAPGAGEDSSEKGERRDAE